jgi:sodium/potassium-transporting ATPase subunit alpha
VNHNNVSLTLNFAISVFVAWVPEGLPATVTILLTIAAKRMAARNVLVKDLQGVETLGAITLLATDKTGTLTRNQMTVTFIWSCLQMHNTFEKQAFSELPGVQEVMTISTLNTRVKFDRDDVPVGQRQILGDATETGLVRFAGENLKTKAFDEMPSLYPKVFEIPFNSENKYAMTIHEKEHEHGSLTLYVKGAPERVLTLCDTILTEKGTVPLTDQHNTLFQETYSFMAGQGHRVLAFAQLLLPEKDYPHDFTFDQASKNYPMSGMTFVGLVSLEDPPKHGVREAIGKCRSAGIKVMMVTGIFF